MMTNQAVAAGAMLASNDAHGRLALVMEDLPGEMALVYDALVSQGYEVLRATSARDAMRQILTLTRRPDIAVLDWNVPETPNGSVEVMGERVADALRQVYPTVPILFRTSLLDASEDGTPAVLRAIERLSSGGLTHGIGKGLDAPSSDVITDDVSMHFGYRDHNQIPWEKLREKECDVLDHAMHEALDHERAKRLIDAVNALLPRVDLTPESLRETKKHRPLE